MRWSTEVTRRGRRAAIAWALLTVMARPAAAQTTSSAAPPRPAAVSTREIVDTVWSGHSVRFALLATSTRLYAAYYDANRQLTVAQRARRGGASWSYRKLDSWVGWDSHNYVTLAVDRTGAVHVAGNMHVDPLTYFQTDSSGDVRTLRRVAVLVDSARERHMTYPVFLTTSTGQLIFKYRDGSSGRGDEIYRVYDERAAQWRPLLDAPLVDGEGQRNAYFVGPTLGPDGWFHLTWVWRDTPMAETNHDLSYARSRDLVHWETSSGVPLALPIRLRDAEIVDPVPVNGGMINGNTALGFDAQGRVMITYHQYDAAGHTQIWLARREATGWTRRPISAWPDYRWDFHGGGSLEFELVVGAAHPGAAGQLVVPVTRRGQSLEFVVDATTLARVQERVVPGAAERLAAQVGIADVAQVNSVSATAPDGQRYTLVWRALPPNRDQPRAQIPAPSGLVLLDARSRR
jgi:hypothetical protein